MDCINALAGYGIEKDTWPIDVKTGMVSNEEFLSFLSTASNAEQLENEKAVLDNKVIPLTCNDVLVGRGKPYQEFPGNVKMKLLVDNSREAYQSGNKTRKTFLRDTIVNAVKASGGRFLQKSDDSVNSDWVEASDNVARRKISHVFRR